MNLPKKTNLDKMKDFSLDSGSQPSGRASSDVESAKDSSELSALRSRFSKPLKISLIILGVIFLFFSLGVIAGLTLKSPVKAAMQSANSLVNNFQDKDLPASKNSLDALDKDLDLLDNKYRTLAWAKYIPLIGGYFKDGQSAINASKSISKAIRLTIKSLDPYADILGFQSKNKSELASQAGESIENKIIFMADTLDKISPELDDIAKELGLASQQLSSINPRRYPKNLAGKQVRGKIISLQTSLKESVQLFSQAKPLIKLMPSLLGNPNAKTYLLLFQNDAELRATGGFMTAYAYLTMSQGKLKPGNSFDIYGLDARWNSRLEAPEPIKKYLKESVWRLRNLNLSPDFKVSMDQFMSAYRDIPGARAIDGIIAIDTTVPVKLLDIIGPIGVGGWGNFSSAIDKRCNCPQVVYALEEIADRPTFEIKAGRKAVLGPLMHSLLANAMGSPKHLWPKLLNSLLTSIQQKHLLFYFLEDNTQKIAEDFNSAGRLKETGGDYLYINDSNFGGAKTDMFIDREVEQEIEQENGLITKTVTLHYSNPHKGSNCNLEAGKLCLNGVYKDWVRVYVPQGSKLIKVIGSEDESLTGEELGKTYFTAFFTMRPQSQSKLVFKYQLPKMDIHPYKLTIQKQPGKSSIKHTIIYAGREQKINLSTDRTLSL